MDFMKISTRSVKQGVTEIFPKFILKKSSDLMIRGGDFYAVWREDLGLWSTEEQDVIDMVDTKFNKSMYVHRDQGSGLCTHTYLCIYKIRWN